MSRQVTSRAQSVQWNSRSQWSELLAICLLAALGFIPRFAFGQDAALPASEISSNPSLGVVLETHSDAGPRATWHLPPATNAVSYWFGPAYHTVFVREPNTSQAATIQRNTVEFTHASFWKFGSNFADIYVNKSNLAEPTNENAGATELYGIFRSKIGLNAVTGTRAFQIGPVRDVAMEIGTNLETKNSVYGPAERTIYVGPNIQFKMPRGYFDLGLHARKEWNKQEIFHQSENYSPNFNIEPTWMIPFSAGKIHLAYTGCADYNTQKGIDSFGNQTVAEFMVRSYVTVDLGELLFHQPERLVANGGLWYWHNEFGKPSSNPGGHEMAPIMGLSFHLGGGSHQGK